MELISTSDQLSDEEQDKDQRAKIDQLPYVIFEYILSHLSPYKDLLDCKLVSKSWQTSVKTTIQKLQRDFISALSSMNVQWHNYNPTGGPSISPRYSHSACCFGDSVYIFGGCTTSNTTFNDLWRFDLASRCWIRPIATGTFPSPKASASLVEYQDTLILFGGWSHSSPNNAYQEWKIFSHVHIFDTNKSRWSLAPIKSFSPAIAGHSASILSDKMIIFGGLKNESNSVTPFLSSNDVWILDLTDWSWMKQPTTDNKPLPRYFHSQIVVNSKNLLIIGGCGGPNMLFSDIWLLTIPEDSSLPWAWSLIEVSCNNNSITPQICFHPACRIGNIVVVLDSVQQYRDLQCKDGKVLRKLSERSHYVNANENGASKLVAQSSTSSSTAHSSNQVQDTNAKTKQPCSKPSRKNRQRQLEGLDRMEQRIKQLKNQTANSPYPIKSATIKYVNTQPATNPMQLFVLDISQVIETHSATWMTTQRIIESPEEIILYSLVPGRAEIIIFGGIYKGKHMKVENRNNDAVSNQLHIVSAKRIII